MFNVSALPSVTWDTVRALHEWSRALAVTFSGSYAHPGADVSRKSDAHGVLIGDDPPESLLLFTLGGAVHRRVFPTTRSNRRFRHILSLLACDGLMPVRATVRCKSGQASAGARSAT